MSVQSLSTKFYNMYSEMPVCVITWIWSFQLCKIKLDLNRKQHVYPFKKTPPSMTWIEPEPWDPKYTFFPLNRNALIQLVHQNNNMNYQNKIFQFQDIYWNQKICITWFHKWSDDQLGSWIRASFLAVVEQNLSQWQKGLHMLCLFLLAHSLFSHR